MISRFNLDTVSKSVSSFLFFAVVYLSLSAFHSVFLLIALIRNLAFTVYNRVFFSEKIHRIKELRKFYQEQNQLTISNLIKERAALITRIESLEKSSAAEALLPIAAHISRLNDNDMAVLFDPSLPSVIVQLSEAIQKHRSMLVLVQQQYTELSEQVRCNADANEQLSTSLDLILAEEVQRQQQQQLVAVEPAAEDDKVVTTVEIITSPCGTNNKAKVSQSLRRNFKRMVRSKADKRLDDLTTTLKSNLQAPTDIFSARSIQKCSDIYI